MDARRDARVRVFCERGNQAAFPYVVVYVYMTPREREEHAQGNLSSACPLARFLWGLANRSKQQQRPCEKQRRISSMNVHLTWWGFNKLALFFFVSSFCFSSCCGCGCGDEWVLRLPARERGAEAPSSFFNSSDDRHNHTTSKMHLFPATNKIVPHTQPLCYPTRKRALGID